MLKPIFKALSILIFSAAFSLQGSAREVGFKVNVANPYVKANEKQKTYVKVSLTGFEVQDKRQRTPVNLSIVLDRSGSMHGEKLARAKKAAIMAISRLNRDDIVSVVTYDDTVSVIVPSTKVRDKYRINNAINKIYSGGSTALFAGVSKGAEEVRKFLDKNRVNRVILLSDGLANVGPSTPGALGDLGSALSKEGISVTTIGLGLGYNEDLMVELAKKSDGNHAFVEHPSELANIFNLEFGDILSVVAQDVEVIIDCGRGVKPLRIFGREGDVHGNKVNVKMNQLYSNQEKFVLLEVEPPVMGNAKKKTIAQVKVSYKNMITKKRHSMQQDVGVKYTKSGRTVEKNVDKDVMVAAVMFVGVEENKRAIALRDKGKIKEAKKILRKNAEFLKDKADKYDSKELNEYGASNMDDSSNLEGPSWNAQRKKMRKSQSKIDMQQSY